MEQEKQPQSADSAASDALQEQYQIISNSLDYLGLVIIATFFSYFALEIQKDQLEAVISGQSDTIPETNLFPLQFSASVMILNAVTYFFGLSEKALQESEQNSVLKESMQMNHLTNVFILLAAALRTYNLVATEFTPQSPQAQQQEQVVLEEEDPLPI